MLKYFIQDGENRKGPYELHELMKLEVYDDTLVWHEGLADWQPASAIQELKPVIRQRMVSPPPPLPEQPLAKSNKNQGIIIGLVAVLIIIVLVVNANRPSSSSVNVVMDPQIEKEIAKESAKDANPADDEILRKQQQQDQIETNKRFIRNNWSNYFLISKSNYDVEGLGGISNLQVYFENKTGYMIENVNAQIDIYTANGYVYKTEYVHFSNVPANGFEVFNVPYSARGTSVSEPRITSIESAILNFCFQSDYVIPGDSEDPFRCN